MPAAQHLQVAGSLTVQNPPPPSSYCTIDPRYVDQRLAHGMNRHVPDPCSPFGFVFTRSDPRTSLEHPTEASKPSFTGPPLRNNFV